MSDNLLSVKDLSIAYTVPGVDIVAVSRATFDVPKGSIVGLVGESGCGKTTMARAFTRIISDNAKITGGSMMFDGQDLVSLPEKAMNALRWRDIAFVPQSAMNSLDPVYRVEYQLNEVLRGRGGMNRAQARARAVELFEMVGIEANRLRDFPHQFSGGMRQRVAIALALALNPKLIVADEPVTALDVIVQRQILDQMRDLQRELGISIIMVTHDISVVAYICDRTVVMYAGEVVEDCDTATLLSEPLHPYTMGLKNAFPDIASAGSGTLTPISGAPPDLASPPSGCRFAARCPFATDHCRAVSPQLEILAPGHSVACHRAHEAPQLREQAAQPQTWGELV
ncbi:ABC transporter ATP-binding protein [Sulfitobacter guttiformis]|uniref:Peptide/nickel transport system ATP-binding protein n=1 Tax=Sulfitobacter guttiformis TaxID=74349 RepID=A0A420DS35_9RHOB|nr:ABC transporter ATP-binding protein [Sulfitobacter guttiformis]KIN74350.1 ABC-type dipeptide/oligopeptide/nickel transport system, ATPase component [Sulfitobacter guttiformis KCTC 32187]RKE96947.1 peptide/nickel transport system ATP-binding protein [Sulfitobacter guttiformis]